MSGASIDNSPVIRPWFVPAQSTAMRPVPKLTTVPLPKVNAGWRMLVRFQLSTRQERPQRSIWTAKQPDAFTYWVRTQSDMTLKRSD